MKRNKAPQEKFMNLKKLEKLQKEQDLEGLKLTPEPTSQVGLSNSSRLTTGSVVPPPFPPPPPPPAKKPSLTLISGGGSDPAPAPLSPTATAVGPLVQPTGKWSAISNRATLSPGMRNSLQNNKKITLGVPHIQQSEKDSQAPLSPTHSPTLTSLPPPQTLPPPPPPPPPPPLPVPKKSTLPPLLPPHPPPVRREESSSTKEESFEVLSGPSPSPIEAAPLSERTQDTHLDFLGEGEGETDSKQDNTEYQPETEGLAPEAGEGEGASVDGEGEGPPPPPPPEGEDVDEGELLPPPPPPPPASPPPSPPPTPPPSPPPSPPVSRSLPQPTDQPNQSTQSTQPTQPTQPTPPPSPQETPVHTPPVLPPALLKRKTVLLRKEKVQTKRANILNEIITTERDYVKDLQLLVNNFLKPMKKFQVIDSVQVGNLFSNVEIILGINTQLLAELEEALTDTKAEDVIVGVTFKKMSDFMKMYATYCVNQPKALETLEECKQKSTFVNFLEECQANPAVRGLNLFSFIIKPVQRLCKYPLFFKDLLNNTPTEHPDFTHVTEALKKISEVVEKVNEAKRQAEDMQKIVDIQTSIEGINDLVQPSRSYLGEGDVLVMYTHQGNSAATDKKLESGHYFLFNDIIVMVRTKKKIYELKGDLPLAATKIVVHSDSETVKNAFELKYLAHTYLLSFPTEPEMQACSRQIKNIIKKFQQIRATAAANQKSTPTNSRNTRK
eukprot:TRINITY_DN5397_c0_g1_i1.p1 TRINITY_DN5397_c0_g1~~TRINITY_DN5397_c0_g1_i1.p1  ORF type:complete len:724 (+),score=162.54 TRINITY_DN5397_c0_g1_i1:74-2245(+)